MKTKDLTEHVYYTTIVGEMCHVRQQLVGTKGIWQGRAATVTAALQVSDDVTMFLESWFGQSAVQTTNQMVTHIQVLTTLIDYQEKGIQV